MSDLLKGKVAVITGASSGMGKAAALLFAKEGANVVLADLNVKDGEAVAEEASKSGSKCVFVRTDVSEEKDIKAMIDAAVKNFGKLDITFNNAGIGGALGSIENISVENWDRTQNVCLRGVFLGIKHSIAPMRAAGGGAIVSTASIAGVWGYVNLHAYSAAKAGVVNLTRSAAIELAKDQIRVNCIAPGGVVTPIVYGAETNRAMTEQALKLAQPWQTAGQPEDIANAALFLSSRLSSFITGHTLIVDGGAVAGPFAMMAAQAPAPRAFAGPSFEQG
jgi:NAD(P)-dependent dehydrogenase (short-subunit alcohol dehydrogenase family)